MTIVAVEANECAIRLPDRPTYGMTVSIWVRRDHTSIFDDNAVQVLTCRGKHVGRLERGERATFVNRPFWLVALFARAFGRRAERWKRMDKSAAASDYGRASP